MQHIAVLLEDSEREWIVTPESPGWALARELTKRGYREIRLPLEVLVGRVETPSALPTVTSPETARYYDCLVEMRRLHGEPI